MKRLASSDSLGAMMSICPNTTDGDHNQVNNNTTSIVYTSSEFQTMLDGLDEEGCCVEESGGHHHISEKKRRLSVDQVKALEKNFEVENKLEPERKVKLAQELGLQPRQVAVWFQNRRARWKTKNLERDYGVLKSSYDGLKLNYEKLQRDNEALLKEIKELKEKLISEDGNSDAVVSDAEVKKSNLETPPVINNFLDEEEYGGPELIKVENFSEDREAFLCGSTLSYFHYDFKKDGSSCDSDSSAILNEDTNNNSTSPKNNASAISSSSHHHHHHHHDQFLDNGNAASSMSFIVYGDDDNSGDLVHHKGTYDYHQDQIVKIEEHNFFGHDEDDESCTKLFSDDQAPSLPWYCSEGWS